MNMVFTNRSRRKRLNWRAGALAAVLLLMGCSVPLDGQDVGIVFLPLPPAQPAGGELPAHLRHSSVLISGQVVPVEPGLLFTIGTSVEGRPLVGYRFGNGSVFVALIGGIHGSYEPNTVILANRFVEFLGESPQMIPSDISVFVIPAMNPDGLVRTGTRGRVNANHVDLNRNWGCKWARDAGSYQGVPFTTGSSAFSEPESRAVRDFLLQNDFKIAVFYHSRGSVIFYGECGGAGRSFELAERVSRATGYRVEDSAEYPTTRALPGSITGEGADYLDSQGLAAIDVELSTRDRNDIDWEENYRGLIAIMEYAVRVYATTESAGQ